MKFESWLVKRYPGVPVGGAASVLELAAEGATVPFMARYRKEKTGNLDEVQIQTILDHKETWDELIKRKAFVLDTIEKQKKLTPELKKKISDTFDPDVLEDLYLPYKQKKKTKAVLAREAGLEPLADYLWKVGQGEMTCASLEELAAQAQKYVSKEKNIATPNDAVEGAAQIIVERLSELTELRQRIREKTFKEGVLFSKKGKEAKENSKFEQYFDFNESISSLLKKENSHRYLALQRGWKQNELVVTLSGKDNFEEDCVGLFEAAAIKKKETPPEAILKEAAKAAFRNYVFAGITTEVHRNLRENADLAGIDVFAQNVRKVLLEPPFGSKTVLGVDPGQRTGCKLAVVDKSGKFIKDDVIYLHEENKKEEAQTKLKKLITDHKVQAVTVGNGTAGRGTETFIRELVKKNSLSIPVVMVNESGASIYSASPVARDEFPDLDITIRGAISIARRFQDPLAELVKIDPKSIGVGQYQHDVSQSKLKKSLSHVVESVVNSVGVDLNTASKHLLTHVSGIGPALADSIESFRSKNGLFKNRESLLAVPRFSQKAFNLAVGFLRVRQSDNPLDNTGIHPEQYPALENFAQKTNKSLKDFIGKGTTHLKAAEDLKTTIGAFTFEDILVELQKPGRDPRENFTLFQFREDLHSLEDLKEGDLCPGIVTNVTNFGAFVDIGVHQDGLVRLSELCYDFVKDPKAVVLPGDQVKVKVLKVDKAKKQISLSMKLEAPPPRPKPKGKKKRAGSPPRKGKGARPQKPRREKPIFNNAFADLAKLKESLKSK